MLKLERFGKSSVFLPFSKASYAPSRCIRDLGSMAYKPYELLVFLLQKILTLASFGLMLKKLVSNLLY